MASDWCELTLEESMDAIIDYRGKTPKKTDSGIPLITAKIIKSGRIETVNEFISEDDYDTWMRRGIPNEGDVVMTTEAPLGEIAQLDGRKIALAQRVITLRGKKDILDNTFLKYLMISEYVQHQLDGRGTGTTVKGIKQSELRKVMLKFPSFIEQKAIAHILGSLDDKIELNRQMNETLEAMAQALFKSWFVDFDPVIDNALATGNVIPDELLERAEQRKGIEKKDNADIQKLFPDEFDFTDEMEWIPKGWEVKCFGDLLDSTIGGDWGKPEQDDKHTRESVIIRGTDIPKLKLGERSEAPTRWVEEKKLKTRVLRPFDIVIEISGGSPTQSTGRSIIITEQILERLGGVAEPASFCRKFSPLNKFLGLYAGIHLQKIYDDGKMWEYQNQSTGIANFQTTSFLEREQLVVPSESVLLKFYETLDPVISKISSNQQIELARLRDTLLPKLMSGELRIPDAEALVEDI